MPRTIVKTRAIVLRTMRMGETSSLVTLYAQECGKLKAMARGARKPKSRFGAALGLMTEVPSRLLRQGNPRSANLERMHPAQTSARLIAKPRATFLWQRRLRTSGPPDDRGREQPPALPVLIWGVARTRRGRVRTGRIAVLVFPVARRCGPRLPPRTAPVHYLPKRTSRPLVVVQRSPRGRPVRRLRTRGTECA